MGFYLRKRKSMGPFAINFSKSGIGISVGVKGARYSVGPNGTFLYLGRGGLYYKKKLNTQNQRALKESVAEPSSEDLIETADIKEFQKSSTDTLIKDINQKNKILEYAPISAVCFGFLFLISLFSVLAWIFLIAGVLTYAYLFKRDVEKKTVLLAYDLDAVAKKAYKELDGGFEELAKSKGLWVITTQQSTADWKRNSGASTLIGKTLFYFDEKLPKYLESNIIPTNFSIGEKNYYLFPDRVLIYQGKEVGAIPYNEIKVSSKITRFVETDEVPEDAEIVGYNWQYMNKDGGPDRRFANNYQIPIVLYSEILLSSDSGLNIILQASQKEAGERFEKAFKSIQKYSQYNKTGS